MTVAVVSAARAQSADTAVAAVNTSVFIAPDATKTPLRVAAAGTTFVVLEEAGEWTKVQFQDPQWGRRVGYVVTKDLRVHRAALAPMDLSVKPETASPAPPEQISQSVPLQPPVSRQPAVRWPHSYVVARTGVTFGTRTAPLVGIEAGSQVAPVLQVYGAFDWHRDISPKLVQDISDLVSAIAGFDVNVRLPAYTLMAGVKAVAPRGSVRPYALGGFGYGRVNGTIEFEGRDVTGLLDSLGVVDKSDIDFNKALFEIGGGVQASHGPLFIDVSYRFRKFLETGSPINVSGLYAGAGVGF
jgi:opacity protein-like surface antigen